MLNCYSFLNAYFQDAKMAKPEVNLMSLLSTFDGISLQPEAEEKEEVKGAEQAPKLPRTNSLEDLGIKVFLFFFFNRTRLTFFIQFFSHGNSPIIHDITGANHCVYAELCIKFM